MATVLPAVHRETITISYRDCPGSDIALMRRSRQLGITKGELLREIVNGALAGVKPSGQGKQEDPLLALLKETYRQAYLALADGVLSPVEREGITDSLVDVLGRVRTRRAS